MPFATTFPGISTWFQSRRWKTDSPTIVCGSLHLLPPFASRRRTSGDGPARGLRPDDRADRRRVSHRHADDRATDRSSKSAHPRPRAGLCCSRRRRTRAKDGGRAPRDLLDLHGGLRESRTGRRVRRALRRGHSISETHARLAARGRGRRSLGAYAPAGTRGVRPGSLPTAMCASWRSRIGVSGTGRKSSRAARSLMKRCRVRRLTPMHCRRRSPPAMHALRRSSASIGIGFSRPTTFWSRPSRLRSSN
jgi:hypothetical protein